MKAYVLYCIVHGWTMGGPHATYGLWGFKLCPYPSSWFPHHLSLLNHASLGVGWQALGAWGSGIQVALCGRGVSTVAGSQGVSYKVGAVQSRGSIVRPCSSWGTHMWRGALWGVEAMYNLGSLWPVWMQPLVAEKVDNLCLVNVQGTLANKAFLYLSSDEHFLFIRSPTCWCL